jgi:prefoldin subunit 5
MGNILLLTDILEQKIRKEKELEYYQQELEKLQQKMWWLNKEIEITNLCIEVIETEKADLVSGRLLSNNENNEH